MAVALDDAVVWLVEARESTKASKTVFGHVFLPPDLIRLSPDSKEVPFAIGVDIDMTDMVYDHPWACDSVTGDIVEWDNWGESSNATKVEMLIIPGVMAQFLRILSCKNIRTVKNHPDERIQKKRAKKGKPPLVSYYTLQLGPVSAKGEARGGGGWSNRVHFVRGHMREYTAAAPLFGKIVGRFWVAPHARGDKEKGMIVKDYEIA